MVAECPRWDQVRHLVSCPLPGELRVQWCQTHPAILRAIVACGWVGIQTWIGGLALDALCRAAWPVGRGTGRDVEITFMVILAQSRSPWILNGTEGISSCWYKLACPLAPCGGGLAAAAGHSRGGGLRHLLAESDRLRGGSASSGIVPVGAHARRAGTGPR